jgi:hypothetical protein
MVIGEIAGVLCFQTDVVMIGGWTCIHITLPFSTFTRGSLSLMGSEDVQTAPWSTQSTMIGWNMRCVERFLSLGVDDLTIS